MKSYLAILLLSLIVLSNTKLNTMRDLVDGDGKHVEEDVDNGEPASPSWANAKSKAKELVGKLTLEEKISLFTGDWRTCVANIFPIEKINFKGMCMQDGPAGIRYAEGHSISWHAGLNTAATFNKELMYKIGKAQGEENKESGINAFLAPCANILRTPQAGRIWEAFGEDPYLSGIAAEQLVKGIQDAGVIAVIKHFVGNDQETSRECSSSNIEVRALMDVYVEPFYRAIKYAGAASVMSAYNAYNNTFCWENKFILTDVLRGILKFQGFVMSDWWAVKHGTPDALNAGLEMNMPGSTGYGKSDGYWTSMKEWVSQGKISEERVTEAAENILSAMFQLNQFESYPPTNIQKETKTDARIAIQRLAATESQVLLKNEDNILPLKGHKKIAVIGADAFPRECQGEPDMKCAKGHVPLGYGSGTTDFDYLIDPLQAITKYAESQGITIVSSGRLNGLEEDVNGGVQAATGADVALVFVAADSGEEYLQLENSWGDRPDLDAWHKGNDLVEAVAKVNKNVVVVINAPGVINLPWLDSVKAVVYSGFPGMESGNGIADVLFGVVNPSGHLPFVWGKIDDYGARISKIGGTKREGSLDQYDYNEGLYVGQRWFDKKGIKYTYPFGWGLSYSKFTYSNLKLSMSKKGLEATFEITNESEVKGKAVPMLFLTFPDTVGEYPKHILKGFEKVEIAGGETKKVTILSDAHALSVFDLSANNYMRVKKGMLKVAIAENGDPSKALLEDSIDSAY